MKRLLLYFSTGKHAEDRDLREVPSTMVDEELVRLTKRVPQTKAERAFHDWLVDWKKKLEKKGGTNG